MSRTKDVVTQGQWLAGGMGQRKGRKGARTKEWMAGVRRIGQTGRLLCCVASLSAKRAAAWCESCVPPVIYPC